MTVTTEQAVGLNVNKTDDVIELEDSRSRSDDVVKSDDVLDDEGGPRSAFAGWQRGPLVRKFWRLYLTGVLVATGGMYVGYGNSVVGTIVANRGFIDQFATLTNAEGQPELDANHISIWGAINHVAQIVVLLISPFTSDRFGRKFNMWAFTFFLTLSIVLEIVAKEVIVMTFSRLAGGAASGCISTSIMVYLSEMALPQFRGALLGSFSLLYALGQVFLFVGVKILNDTNPMAFRNVFYSEFVFFGIWLVPLLYIPESPAWLCAKGRHDQAKRALRRLVGNVDGYDVDHEYAFVRYEVDKSHALMQESKKTPWQSPFTKLNFKRVVISTLPFTMQNFVGTPFIFGYTTYFFQLANLDDPFLGNIIVQLVLVVGIITGFYVVDKIGRRTLVFYGGIAMCVICLIIGGLGWMPSSTAGGSALVSLCTIWAFIYANSLAPIGWISLVEVSTPQLRAKTAAFAAVIQACSGILFNYTVPLMLNDRHAGWGQKIGIFFAGITAAYLVPVWFLYPETKGRTYAELDELFNAGVPAWRFHKTTTSHQQGLQRDQERKHSGVVA